ncbi:hypothetical protein [Deinococcus humi]|uniref:Uncharacterized protein n=1 Tax=Deinococcus humi TaxID=662880 RepID=A0A7W8JSU4_9DEIO|nr:hypothetical protein [Deinococcus humi]MBB5361353.1 hypothetical protein [Deinococcus humi]
MTTAIRQECHRRLSIGVKGVYLTLKRDRMPTGNPRLAGRSGPCAEEVCMVRDAPEGGYQIVCIFDAAAVLKFLDRAGL